MQTTASRFAAAQQRKGSVEARVALPAHAASYSYLVGLCETPGCPTRRCPEPLKMDSESRLNAFTRHQPSRAAARICEYGHGNGLAKNGSLLQRMSELTDAAWCCMHEGGQTAGCEGKGRIKALLQAAGKMQAGTAGRRTGRARCSVARAHRSSGAYSVLFVQQEAASDVPNVMCVWRRK